MLLSLINDLLDMGRMSSGNMKIVKGEYDISEILSDMYMFHVQKAENKDLIFSYNYDSKLPKKLFGDAVRIQQIITNLITNSIKYTNEGSIDVDYRFKDISKSEIELIVTVTDTGMGIKKEDLPYIYDSFSRFEEQKHRHIEGTGIGLAITKRLVELMRGSIVVDSEYGKGTSFTVRIPQIIVDTEPVGQLDLTKNEPEEELNKHFVAEEAKVLVVDDNRMNLEVIKGMLKHLHINVDAVESGLEAIEKVKETRYDIIFMDHMMPVMDGVEALHRIREDQSHPNTQTPVIVMTANAIIGAKETYMAEGFTDYISKPVNMNLLEEMIGHYLSSELMTYQDTTEEEKGLILPDIEGVQWAEAIKNSPDTEVLLELIRTFCVSAKNDINVLNENYSKIIGASDEDSLGMYKIKVHAMKHSAILVGAKTLSEDAFQLEMAAGEGRTNDIMEKHSRFVSDYADMADRLGEAFAGKVLLEETKKEYNASEFAADLDAIEQAMKDFDTLGANELIAQVGNVEGLPQDIKEALSKLTDAVRDFDEDTFYKTIEIIRGTLD